MRVRVELWSDAPHLQQLLTGLVLLHRRGCIQLSQLFIPEPETRYALRAPHLNDAHLAHLRLITEDDRHLYFDFHDSHEINRAGLDWADAYFKRSLCPEDAAAEPKLKAYGLNYLVLAPAPDRFAWSRARHFNRGDWIRHFAALTGADRIIPERCFLPRLPLCQRRPTSRPPDKILFQTRLWDPAEAPSAEKAADWEQLNAFRIQCAQALREAFPSGFVGGVAPTPLAQRFCSPELLIDPAASRKHAYFRQLHQSAAIGVTSTGLHGSTGWKFAEYIAFSMPILSEGLYHSLPGSLSEGKHYQSFDSVDGLVKKATNLMEHPSDALQMAQHNQNYYAAYLHPEQLAKRVLNI